MIFDKILRSSLNLNRIYYHRFIRFTSTLSKEKSLNQKKSNNRKKSTSEYLADDMYNYTPFSYYDIEVSMTKYRLPQPSSYTPFKPESSPQKK